MFYRIKDNKILDYADYKYVEDCKELSDYTMSEYTQCPEKYIVQGDILVDNPNYEQELTTKERERVAMLNMTGADVERAIYKVKGIDFDDILAMVKDNPAIDEKALKIEFKANNFFRGNPYIEQVGALLGFTSEMLDRFFETKDYHELLPKEVENENTTDTTTDANNEDEVEAEPTGDVDKE